MSVFLVSALHRSKAAGDQRIAVVVEHEAVGERLRHSNYRPPHMNKKCGDDIARKVETTVAKRIGSGRGRRQDAQAVASSPARLSVFGSVTGV